MALRSLRKCKFATCKNLVRGSYCAAHASHFEAEEQKKKDSRLERTKETRQSSYKQGYNRKWQAARAVFLLDNPFCVECLKNNNYVQATIVDHIKPHKGDMELFWDVANWQPLCKSHHNSKTASEDGGFGNKRVSKDAKQN